MLVRLFKETCVKWFGIYDYYHMNYMIYAVSGMWTLKTKYVEYRRELLYTLYFLRLLVLLINVLIVVTMIYDVYLVWGNIEKLTYSMSSTVFYLGSLHRFLVLIPKVDELEECLETLDKNFYLDFVGRTEKEEKILKEAENQLKKLSIFFYFILTAGIIARGICHLNPLERMLMIPFPFVELVPTPFFEFLFVFQSALLVHYMSAIIASEMVVYGCIIRISKHFEIIQSKINDITFLYKKSAVRFENNEYFRNNLMISRKNPVENINDKFFNLKGNSLDYLQWRRKTTNTLIKKCIIHHQSIIVLMQKLNKLFSESFFIQIFGGGVLLAILFVDIMWKSKSLSMKTIAQGVYAIGFFINVTVLCIFGSKIEVKVNIQSHETANCLYEVPWLQMDEDNRKHISLFLAFLWRHPYFKAGGVFPVNLTTFLKSVQIIYNFVAFWQNSAKRTNTETTTFT